MERYDLPQRDSAHPSYMHRPRPFQLEYGANFADARLGHLDFLQVTQD